MILEDGKGALLGINYPEEKRGQTGCFHFFFGKNGNNRSDPDFPRRVQKLCTGFAPA
jgi:hypothetical protein